MAASLGAISFPNDVYFSSPIALFMAQGMSSLSHEKSVYSLHIVHLPYWLIPSRVLCKPLDHYSPLTEC